MVLPYRDEDVGPQALVYAQGLEESFAALDRVFAESANDSLVRLVRIRVLLHPHTPCSCSLAYAGSTDDQPLPRVVHVLYLFLPPTH